MNVFKTLFFSLLLVLLTFISTSISTSWAAPYNPSPSMREVTGNANRTMPGYTPGIVQASPSTPSAEAVRRTPPVSSSPAVGPATSSPVRTISPDLQNK